MKFSLSSKVRLGFGLALLLLLGISANTVYCTLRFTRAVAERRQSYEANLLLESLMDSLRDAETGQRGFLLTMAPGYLGPYQEQIAKVPERLAALEERTHCRPEQAERIAAVRKFAALKMAELAETVRVAQDPQQGLPSALAIVRTDRGKRLMDEIRAQVGAMQAAEQKLRDRLAAQADSAAAQTLITVIVGSGAGCLAVALASLAVGRDIAGRKRAEDQLQLAHHELERRVEQRTAELAETNQQLRVENQERLRAQQAATSAEQEVRRLNEDLEQRVADRTAQLETANRELEAFSYSVSHDLRAPLRSIDGFSQALLEDYTEALDDAGKGYLQRIRRATMRMAQLIDDLLNLARVSRTQLSRERVDLTSVAREVAAELRQREPQRQVEVAVASGAEAEGDPRLLRVVLENLLGNAWKFTGKRATARIEFGVDGGVNRRTFYVRDNGAGFDMAFAGKLFGPFQRLHAMDEFAGTGIGLATVQRIVQRHGGRVWARSAVGEGATFFFSL